MLLLLNIVPLMYHNMYLGTKTVKAFDAFGDENGDDDGGDDGGDDGDDDDDDNNDDCSDPGDIVESDSYHDYYVSGTALYAIDTHTVTNTCSGETSSSDQAVLVDDCTNPAYLTVSYSEPHDYFLSGNSIYGVVTKTTTNNCNDISTTEDENVLDEEGTQEYSDFLSSLPTPNLDDDFTDVSGLDGPLARDTNVAATVKDDGFLGYGYFVTFIWHRTNNVITADGFDSGTRGFTIGTEYKQSNFAVNVSGNVINFDVRGTITYYIIIKDFKAGSPYLLSLSGYLDVSNGKKHMKSAYVKM